MTAPVRSHEEIFRQDIAPLAQQIRRICLHSDLPYLLHFVLDVQPTTYSAAGSAHLGTHPDLTDLRIANAILRGDAEPVLPSGDCPF